MFIISSTFEVNIHLRGNSTCYNSSEYNVLYKQHIQLVHIYINTTYTDRYVENILYKSLWYIAMTLTSTERVMSVNVTTLCIIIYKLNIHSNASKHITNVLLKFYLVLCTLHYIYAFL